MAPPGLVRTKARSEVCALGQYALWLLMTLQNIGEGLGWPACLVFREKPKVRASLWGSRGFGDS